VIAKELTVLSKSLSRFLKSGTALKMSRPDTGSAMSILIVNDEVKETLHRAL